MRQVQRTEPSIALERQFGLRGHIGIGLDEVAVPVVDVGDFIGRSPYEVRKTGMIDTQSPAGGAAAYSYVWITPGANSICVVEEVWVYNTTGSTQTPVMMLFRPADIVTIGETIDGRLARLNGRITPGGLIESLSCYTGFGNHTNATTGGRLGSIVVPDSRPVNQCRPTFPRGIVLDGTDPAGPISFGFVNPTLNKAMHADFIVSEYAASP